MHILICHRQSSPAKVLRKSHREEEEGGEATIRNSVTLELFYVFVTMAKKELAKRVPSRERVKTGEHWWVSFLIQLRIPGAKAGYSRTCILILVFHTE